MNARTHARIPKHFYTRCTYICKHTYQYAGTHGDLKPRNLVQVGLSFSPTLCLSLSLCLTVCLQVEIKTESGTELVWVLIDLDASCEMGALAGQKVTSSAFIPPELARQQLAPPPSEASLVKASVQLEMWTFGVMLYQLCTVDGETLWHANQADNIDDIQLHQLAYQWPEVKAAKMNKIVWPKAAHLVGLLLQEDPKRRPNSWDRVTSALSLPLAPPHFPRSPSHPPPPAPPTPLT